MQGLDGTKALLRRIWSPVVMVVASPEAEDLCQGATGLAVAELLRPFGVLHQLNDGLGGRQTSQAPSIDRLASFEVLPNASSPPPMQSLSGRLRSSRCGCTNGSCASTLAAPCSSPTRRRQTPT